MRLSSRRPHRAALGPAAAVTAAVLAVSAPAGAEPPGAEPTSPQGRGDAVVDDRDGVAALLPAPAEQAQARVSAAPAAGRSLDAAYPRQQVLPEPAVDDTDRSIKLGLVPYHAIAPALNELQAASDRVSVEVLGESVRGRQLHLVTVTSPESAEQVAEQERLRTRMTEDPAAAAADVAGQSAYKTPVFVNANIHGNEWEGTDAVLRIVTDLATSTDPAVQDLLDTSRLYVVMTMNPDGRVAGTRANGSSFDMNRDFATASQPEVRAVRQALVDTQPLVMLDLHGYVNGTLIEPTTPPHGENYEYDLFIRQAYPNGLAMEAAVNGLGYTAEADGVLPAQIPFRDDEEGWDDWPPIFTPQYAAFHGAVAHTVEIPLRVNNASYDQLPVEELRRRAAINTDVAEAATRAAIEFADTNRASLLADHIEIFRRGDAGEAQRPVPEGWVPGIGPEDVYTTTFPRAYVIPTRDQRSAPAAARLVDHLIANDVRVQRLARPVVGDDGTRYAAGSYVVDMHQAKRGLANVLLAPGRDISPDVDTMYDISGWSLGLLWGASVGTVSDGDVSVAGRPLTEAAPTGAVTGPAARDLALQLDDPADLAALDALLEAGVAVRWTDAGEVVVPAAARAQAEQVAAQFGVVLAATRAPGGPALETPVVAVAGAPDELFALGEMGFDVVPVSTATAGTLDWSAVDALYVASGLSAGQLDAAGRAAVQSWLDDGGGVVARGSTGAAFNASFGLLTATRVAGRSDANGVVTVDNGGGPLTADALPHAFVSAPSWFTGLGPEVAVERSYTVDGPLVSGHWRPTAEGTGGPDDAAGQAVLIRGIDETGSAVAVFGDEPLYRAHPKGEYAQVGRALYWSAATAG